MRKLLLLCGLLLSLSGCQDPIQTLLSTDPIKPGDTIPPNTAVVLVGMPLTDVNYMSFNWSSLGAITVLPPSMFDRLIAVPVGVGKTGFHLSTYSTGRHGYMPSGISFGYINAQTPPINIDRPGIYFIGNIDPTQPNNYNLTLRPLQLAELRQRLGNTFGNLQPINFTWP